MFLLNCLNLSLLESKMWALDKDTIKLENAEQFTFRKSDGLKTVGYSKNSYDIEGAHCSFSKNTFVIKE